MDKLERRRRSDSEKSEHTILIYGLGFDVIRFISMFFIASEWRVSLKEEQLSIFL